MLFFLALLFFSLGTAVAALPMNQPHQPLVHHPDAVHDPIATS